MATIRDNYVQLNLAGIKILSFEVTAHSISDGQPYDGVHVEGDDQLNVRAGRHGTVPVAQWFRDQAGSGVVTACSTSDTYPDELNFAVIGTLTFESADKTWVVKEMLLAQGHNLLGGNNWWVGGPHMEGGSMQPFIGAVVSTAFIADLPIGKVGFIASPGCVSHFDLVVAAIT